MDYTGLGIMVTNEDYLRRLRIEAETEKEELDYKLEESKYIQEFSCPSCNNEEVNKKQNKWTLRDLGSRVTRKINYCPFCGYHLM